MNEPPSYRCEALRERLTAYHLGDLPARDREGVERHLQECPDCRTISRELELTIRWTREALTDVTRMAHASGHLSPERRARVLAPPQPASWWVAPPAGLRAAAVWLVVVAGAVAAWVRLGIHRPSERAATVHASRELALNESRWGAVGRAGVARNRHVTDAGFSESPPERDHQWARGVPVAAALDREGRDGVFRSVPAGEGGPRDVAAEEPAASGLAAPASVGELTDAGVAVRAGRPIAASAAPAPHSALRRASVGADRRGEERLLRADGAPPTPAASGLSSASVPGEFAPTALHADAASVPELPRLARLLPVPEPGRPSAVVDWVDSIVVRGRIWLFVGVRVPALSAGDPRMLFLRLESRQPIRLEEFPTGEVLKVDPALGMRRLLRITDGEGAVWVWKVLPGPGEGDGGHGAPTRVLPTVRLEDAHGGRMAELKTREVPSAPAVKPTAEVGRLAVWWAEADEWLREPASEDWAQGRGLLQQTAVDLLGRFDDGPLPAPLRELLESWAIERKR